LVLAPIWRRRRLIAIAALLLIGAILLVVLSSGGQPVSSPQGPPSLNGSDVPAVPGSQPQTQGRTPR
jgi:hypothetical protein